MAETSTNLGRVSLVPRGEYDPTAQYRRLDIVSYNGSSYLALRNLQGVTPADGADYMLIACAGEDGAPGADGADGAPGNSIASIERTSGTGAAGTTDTYTITMTDGSAYTFQVYNGADGSGTGDMIKSTYDPQGKSTDVFAYADEGLALKQPLLAGQPGQVVGFDADGAAVAHQADAAQVSYDGTQSGLQAETVQGAVDELSARTARVSNLNLLHNWYWADPVNQRRQLAYTEAGYAIDRWRTDGGVTVENGFITLSPSIAIFQKFENQEIFFGSTVTISALTADGQLITSTGVLPQLRPSVNTNYIPTDTNGIMVYMRISEEDQQGGAYVAFYLGNGRSTPVNMLAAKVEPGPVQTLAHKVGDTWVLNDPPPDKALELLKCQRFYSDAGTVRGLAGYISEGGKYGTFFVPTPATMRANPAVTYTSATIRVAGTDYSAENVSLSKLSSCGIAISAASPGMTAYASQPCGFFAENLAFSADL